MTTTTTTSSRRGLDAGAAEALRLAYQSLVKAGNDSVRAAWRFGQTIDSLSDTYTRAQIADAIGISTGTVYRYVRLYAAYQRPELAIAASEQLETYNIDLIVELAAQLKPVPHGRPMAGRHFRYRCTSCGSTEIKREETEEDEHQ